MNTHTDPPPAELASLLQGIGPLPLTGQAWPDWVRILAWILLALLGVEMLTTLIRMPPENVNPFMLGLLVVCFLALAAVAWFMQTSNTTIDARGLHQTWFTRRDIAWEDVQSARFVPLIFSKRLLVISRSGRPLVIQGGTRDLHKAFMQIAATYRPGRPRMDTPPDA